MRQTNTIEGRRRGEYADRNISQVNFVMGRSSVSGKRFVMPANLPGKPMPPPHNPHRQTIIGEEDDDTIASREKVHANNALSI